jgi:hypothetical protein
MMTAPAALFFDDVLELAAPVSVGTVVTVPVPALPAWFSRPEQELLVDPVWILAWPPKSQAVEALPWFL